MGWCLLFPLLGYAQSDAYALQRILQRFTELYGGFRDADALASISVEGTIEQDGGTYDFMLRKKRPYSMRYRLSNESMSIVTGYNGSVGWKRIEVDGVVAVESLDAESTSLLRKKARFESPLFRHLEKRGTDISLFERTTFAERSVYVLEVIESSEQKRHYYMDVLNAHVLRMDTFDAQGRILEQSIYRDYREVDGFPFAFEIENRVGDAVVSRVEIESVDVNPGLLSFYFEEPR